MWTVADKQFCYDEYECNATFVWGPEGEGFGAIAVVLDQTGGDLEGDAKLIAAAPELLRACKTATALLDRISAGQVINPTHLVLAQKQLQAAIDKTHQ